jgi:hypothetical protein
MTEYHTHQNLGVKAGDPAITTRVDEQGYPCKTPALGECEPMFVADKSTSWRQRLSCRLGFHWWLRRHETNNEGSAILVPGAICGWCKKSVRAAVVQGCHFKICG